MKNIDEKKVNVDIKKRMKRITALYLTIFLTVILMISLYINMSSFKSQFISNELSFYSISGGRVVDKIENGLLYGKVLDNFYGMDVLLEGWSEKNKEVENVRLLSADKEEIYYQMIGEVAYQGADVDESTYLEIRDGNGDLCGYLNIAVNLEEPLKPLLRSQISFLIGALILILAGVLAIIVFCMKNSFITEELHIEKKKILVFMLVLVLLMQSVFTIYSSIVLRGFYIETSKNMGKEIQTLIQDDVDKVIGQGVSYDQIYDFESYANSVIEKAPMIESIELEGERLSVSISENYVETIIRKMLIDMVTILVTSMFIAAEIVNLMMISINRRVEKISGIVVNDKQLRIRVSSFLIHVACYLPISFIPIMMYQLTGGNASDFLLGLPIMVLFATGLVFTMLAGDWSIRFGWRKLLLAGVVLVIISSLVAGLVQNAIVLIIARGIYGAAYALIYIAIREFAALGADRQERSKGLSQVTAGLYAGINIGAVLGAIIYTSVGFGGVFIISAVIGILAFFVAKRYCVAEDTFKEEKVEDLDSSELILNGKGMISMLKNRELIWLGLFIIVPLAIMSVFFEYFIPVYAVKAGIGSADIGRAFLINGIAIAYGAPLMVKYFAGRINEKLSVFLFTTLMAVGFIVFGVMGGIAGILVASAIMGIGEGTAIVSQNMIMLDLEVAKKLGTSRMLSIYSTIRKLSQTVGPQIFAAFMMMGYQFGMILFGAAAAFLCMIYIWGGWTNRGELYK